MALVAKSTSQQGQISIFFSASLVILVSIVAFVINIGLFVKAKINLQNATDAAAFAGAATQARQLTKIAYLNWEMRNIYKEWMFKYYVVGNLNIDDVMNPDRPDGDPKEMSFRMKPDVNVLAAASDPNAEVKDHYNFPSVCVHLSGSQTNICRHYAIPGLPEFGSSNLPGAEEASRAFMDNLIGTKINDCVERTRLNMFVASSWIYNVLGQDTLDQGGGPAVMTDRQGAWPRAVELAMRIRNLEYVMNRPAHTERVCIQSGNSTIVPCNKSISEVSDENKLGNERIVKAFYSGYRNIGGNYDGDEMKNSFTLTEISPRTTANLGTKRNASYLLFPEDKVGDPKPFVDLKLMMANYAIFYSAMIPRATPAGAAPVSGACDVSKVAIPVPGYPLGFYKNPDIITYYAVRGEAEFEGMFNPFSDQIKLTAYAAAKPFGGRIGPILFNQRGGDQFYGRGDPLKKRSVPYMSALKVEGTPVRGGGILELGDYVPGVPLPVNSSPPATFWIDDAEDAIGGMTNDPTAGVQFGIPNLVYDYETLFSSAGYTLSAGSLNTIDTGLNVAADEPVGLFSKFQFKKFKGSLGTSVSAQHLEYALARVRAPTRYEAANYLIPTPSDGQFLSQFTGAARPDSFGFISGPPIDGGPLPNVGVFRYRSSIYAPLYMSDDQSDVLFDDADEVVRTISDFLKTQQSGIDTYRDALNMAAFKVYEMKNSLTAASIGSGPEYVKAASGISDIDFTLPTPGQSPETCKSLAGQFLFFYFGHADLFPGYVQDHTTCPVGKTLLEVLKTYYANGDPSFSPTHYQMEYSWDPANFPGDPTSAFTAYAPGKFTGVGNNGVFKNPIANSDMPDELMRRNFYSTKFIPINSVTSTTDGYANQRFLIMSEGAANAGGAEITQTQFLNVLEPEDDLSSIKH